MGSIEGKVNNVKSLMAGPHELVCYLVCVCLNTRYVRYLIDVVFHKIIVLS